MAVDKNMSILIVEDNGTMRKIIHNLVSQLGFHNIVQAVDGSSALQKLSENNIQLIVSDWNMVPMTGLDFLKAVRTNPATKDIPFIMLTGESKTENIVAAHQAGVNGYIVKPFNLTTLKEKLTAVIGEF
jgi:two-component system chemotaxis response regulator CheY